MTERIHNWLSRISSGPLSAALMTLSLLLMAGVNLINLPLSVGHIKQVSGGADILDTRVFYTPQGAYGALDALQPAGRQLYLRFLVGFDLLFPLLYSIALATLLTVVLRRAFPGRPRMQRLNLMPLGAGLFDYLENMAIITLLVRYPTHVDGVALIAGYSTLLKWSFTGISLVLLVLGLVVARGRKSKLQRLA